MWRTLAIACCLGGCAGPGQTAPNATPAPSDADAGDATADTEAALKPEETSPLVWHTIDVSGDTVEYATLGEPREGGPVLLALPPGPQTRPMVEAGLERWADAMATDGWFVVSPTSPKGTFFEESAAVLPPFVEATAKHHGFPPRGLLLFGMSNGGLSAFKLAIADPGRFRALVTIPGRPTDEDMTRVDALSGIPVAMVVGADDDAFWKTGAETASAALDAAGGNVTLQVVPDTGHAAHIDIDWPALRKLFGA
ncbi:MAG: hypothetical protein AAF721_37820 [Myxococcota bacterium]